MVDRNFVRNPLVPRTTLCKEDEGTPVDATKIQASNWQSHVSLSYPTRFDVWSESRLQIHEQSKESLWAARKRILRYLKGTVEHDIFYQKGKKTSLIIYSDNSYAED